MILGIVGYSTSNPVGGGGGGGGGIGTPFYFEISCYVIK